MVYNKVWKVWDNKATKTFLDAICNQVLEKDRLNTNTALNNFLYSMWVTMLNTRNKGNILASTFWVYAIREMINKDRT